MSEKSTLLRILILSALAGGLAACGTMEKLKPGQKTDYRQSRAENTLEVPPDLTVSTIDDTMAVPDITPDSTATYSAYSSERGGDQAPAARGENVLVAPETIRVQQDGDKRWLVIEGEDAAAVWTKMREFWLQNGFLIKREDPRIGILETDWAENRADIPLDPIRNVIGKAFDNAYSAPTRDMYRVRLERGEGGVIELYIAHRGVLEAVQGDTTVWQERPSNPELEAEMLSRMMLFFGVEERKAKRMVSATGGAPVRANLIQGADGAALQLDEDFSRAWRRTGLALDRVGFSVEDRDRSKGVYFVRYDDPLADQDEEGMLSKLKFWGSDEAKSGNVYQIKLDGTGASTRVTVLDASGAPERSGTATRILTLLQEQLK